MSGDRDAPDPWDGWEIVATYRPEIVPNERRLEPCADDELPALLARFTGTERYHADSGLLLTDGAKWLLDATGGYALLRVVRGHLSAIAREPGAFTVLDLEPDGAALIHDGREERRYLALARPGVRVPHAVRLFTGAFGGYLVLMLAGEY